ncbi:MAG TPA: PQQ-binding-like beta-propeller repeat protein [Planctomycetota bacterium]|jgi:outer membrane protein assembly factor BamB|nr:PQQ-binding-like beta-propeller repeat protein [Planctomycetota bacterium]
MARVSPLQDLLFVGIKGSVVALHKATGEVAWSIKLRQGASYVPILAEGGFVFALSGGEVTCLSAADGKPVWHNELKGFGRGHSLLAGAQNAGVAPAAAAAEEAQARAATIPVG